MVSGLADSGSKAGVSSTAPRPLSSILCDLGNLDHQELRIGDIAVAISGRSQGALLAFFAVLNVIPLPPGSTLILGLPVVLISVRLLLSQKTLWLPRRVSAHVVGRDAYAGIAGSILPRLVWLEKFLKPRYWPFSGRKGELFVGAVCLILGLIVVLPIPLGNAGPAIAACVLGLALSERDGLWLAAGLITAAVAIMFTGAIVTGAALAASAALNFGN